MRRHMLGVILALSPASVAHGGTLSVPQGFATIQAAIDAAQAGDTVAIGGGLYQEAVTVDGKTDLVIQGKGAVRIRAAGGAALTFIHCVNIDVNHLRIEEGDGHAIVVADSEKVVFTKCIVRPHAGGPLMPSVLVKGSVDTGFVKCRFADTEGTAIVAGESGEPAEHLYVINSRFERIGSHGIEYIDSIDPLVGTTIFTNITGDGLHAEASATLTNLFAINNTYLEVQGCGARLAAGNDLLVGGSVFKWVGECAIEAAGDGLQFNYNKIRKANVGIVANGTGPGLTSLSLNTIKDTDGVAIQASGSYVGAFDNKITGANGAGIVVTGLKIAGNFAVGPDVTVYGNTIKEAALAGDMATAAIDVSAADAQVASNVVIKSGAAGVLVGGLATRVQDNTVISPAGDGFRFANTGGTVDGNTCLGAGGIGFHLAGTDHTLTSNTAGDSVLFDLVDLFPGQNTIDASNNFGTTGP